MTTTYTTICPRCKQTTFDVSQIIDVVWATLNAAGYVTGVCTSCTHTVQIKLEGQVIKSGV